MGTKANVCVGLATLKIAAAGSAATDVGYTDDGVEMEYAADFEDVRVDQESLALDKVITAEKVTVKCNLAEATLANLRLAIAGMEASGDGIGAGVTKYVTVVILGKAPSGATRTITIQKGVCVGPVGLSYKKGQKNLIPFAFEALVPDSGEAVTIADGS
ncbi:MAG: hypothetical protein GHCLOJNM_01570 [bacterium]|nr:hypothetical protein [bacterium]